ncbi:helix-turn-helix domain-containing protein [Streptosporangium minutum]|uniref:helix-turn-helix domain-containing protein n=1 Tax=Streptosporangium minutum TaxID=569862 RepID=UPI00310156E8
MAAGPAGPFAATSGGDRQRAGRAWGGGGRPAKLSAEQIRLARARYEARDVTVAEIAKALGVSRGTIYRALQQTP